MNGIKIKTAEEFQEIYEKSPALGMALIFENVEELKERCDCRYAKCLEDQKKSRFKNVTIQAAGGVVGGAVAAWAFISKLWE